MADTRLFRITRELRVEYGTRQQLGSKLGNGGYSWNHGPIVKVEATNAEATEGWTDVTGEFLK